MNLALTAGALQIQSEEASGLGVWSAECSVSSSVSFDFENTRGGFDDTLNFQLRRGDRPGSSGTVIWEAQERGHGRNEDVEKVLDASTARLCALRRRLASESSWTSSQGAARRAARSSASPLFPCAQEGTAA
ncbi:hypothetical protein SAMN00790413_06245 [Deinococcus hopiensis KR-140]|uniref:Uncharacterized protein n=1 Tax=Deinococcus hopiensis KR-140 TaxID=695939 RepID=A0A1W1VUB0_9DEIO|nr:hypothetical protein SAMN00790413_06245 [Deinococcus hopiensis KR-140]